MEDHFLIRHSHFYSECCINTPSLFQPFHFPQSRLILFFVWCDIRLSMVTHTWNLCSVLTHPKCTHTVVSTHTHTHTAVNMHPEQWATIYAAAPGEQLGVRCLAQEHLVMVLKEERALYIHSPHLQSLPDRDSNSQPFNYESDSLTIRPRLPVVIALPVLNFYE